MTICSKKGARQVKEKTYVTALLGHGKGQGHQIHHKQQQQHWRREAPPSPAEGGACCWWLIWGVCGSFTMPWKSYYLGLFLYLPHAFTYPAHICCYIINLCCYVVLLFCDDSFQTGATICSKEVRWSVPKGVTFCTNRCDVCSPRCDNLLPKVPWSGPPMHNNLSPKVQNTSEFN